MTLRVQAGVGFSISTIQELSNSDVVFVALACRHTLASAGIDVWGMSVGSLALVTVPQRRLDVRPLQDQYHEQRQQGHRDLWSTFPSEVDDDTQDLKRTIKTHLGVEISDQRARELVGNAAFVLTCTLSATIRLNAAPATEATSSSSTSSSTSPSPSPSSLSSPSHTDPRDAIAALAATAIESVNTALSAAMDSGMLQNDISFVLEQLHDSSSSWVAAGGATSCFSQAEVAAVTPASTFVRSFANTSQVPDDSGYNLLFPDVPVSSGPQQKQIPVAAVAVCAVVVVIILLVIAWSRIRGKNRISGTNAGESIDISLRGDLVSSFDLTPVDDDEGDAVALPGQRNQKKVVQMTMLGKGLSGPIGSTGDNEDAHSRLEAGEAGEGGGGGGGVNNDSSDRRTQYPKTVTSRLQSFLTRGSKEQSKSVKSQPGGAQYAAAPQEGEDDDDDNDDEEEVVLSPMTAGIQLKGGKYSGMHQLTQVDDDDGTEGSGPN